MKLQRIAIVTSFALLTVGLGEARAQSPAATPAAPMVTLQMPAVPAPVAVSLDPATTAIEVNDLIDPICKSQPACTGTMIPAMATLLARARKAGVFIVYSAPPAGVSKFLPQVAPAPGDPIVAGHGQDRFHATDLQKILASKGVETLILAGWKVSGSVLYTSVGATLRGLTVVVPEDGSLDSADYAIAIGRFQILNQNAANAANQPLKHGAATLSRTDLITFK